MINYDELFESADHIDLEAEDKEQKIETVKQKVEFLKSFQEWEIIWDEIATIWNEDCMDANLKGEIAEVAAYSSWCLDEWEDFDNYI